MLKIDIKELAKYMLALSVTFAPAYAQASDNEESGSNQYSYEESISDDADAVANACICKASKDKKDLDSKDKKDKKDLDSKDKKDLDSKDDESKDESSEDANNYCVCADGSAGKWKNKGGNKTAPSSTQVIRGK